MIGISRKLLAVEVDGDNIRAAVVRRVGKKFDIIDFATLIQPDSDDDLPSVAAVKSLAERLQHTGGPVVFVTPIARTFDLIMDRAKVHGVKPYQLKAAVKWEVEPYTGITGNNALIGVQPAHKSGLAPGEVDMDDEEAPVTISVSAMERNVYRALKARFKAAGFALLRVYPPDITFFMPLLMQPSVTAQAILEVGENISNFAILRGRMPEQISTMSMSVESITAHLSGEVVSPEMEESLRFTVRQVPAPEPLIVSGAGASMTEVLGFISGFCPNGARPLALSRATGIADAKDDPAHAVYACVVGAAIRELLGRRERVLGIDDSVELRQRVKKSAYIAPLATSMAMALLLLGHYGYMRHQEGMYKDRIRELSTELKERKVKIAEYDGLIREDEQIKEKVAFAGKRLTFISGQADKDLSRIIDCLGGIAAAVSDSIVLSGIAQNGSGTCIVTGTAFDLGGIGRFTSGLQAMAWCESAVLRKLEKVGNPSPLLVFELTVTIRRESS